MDRRVRPCYHKPTWALLPDLYPDFVASFFTMLVLNIKTIARHEEGEEEEWEEQHQHHPVHLTKPVVMLGATCKGMHAAVAKNAILDRGRAVDRLFLTFRNSVTSWWGQSGPLLAVGPFREFSTLKELYKCCGKQASRNVYSIYIKCEERQLKILLENTRIQAYSQVKHIFSITDASDNNIQVEPDSDSETPHEETLVTNAELTEAVHQWLQTQRDAVIVPTVPSAV